MESNLSSRSVALHVSTTMKCQTSVTLDVLLNPRERRKEASKRFNIDNFRSNTRINFIELYNFKINRRSILR